MLLELLEYWTTPVAHPAVRPLGYLHESIALKARYQRCRQQWDPHYQRCREAIEAAGKAARGGRALILGAGLLHDIPLEWLTRRFEQVVLLDLVWLRCARRRIRACDRVRVIEHDITESLSDLLAGGLHLAQPKWGLDQAFDLVVSLNLVTQLPLLPARWLLRQGVDETQIDAYGRGLIEAHLDYLRQFNRAQVCLIADRRIMERDRTGRQTDGIDPWWGVTPPVAASLWWWEAVPPKEGRGFSRRHQVGVSQWRNG